MKKKILIIISAVIIVALVVTGVMLLVSNKDKKDNNKETTTINSAMIPVDHTKIREMLNVKSMSEIDPIVKKNKYQTYDTSDGGKGVFFVDVFGYDGTVCYYHEDDDVKRIVVEFFYNTVEDYDMNGEKVKNFDKNVRKHFADMLGDKKFTAFNVYSFSDEYFTDKYPDDHFEGVALGYSRLQYPAKLKDNSYITMDVYCPGYYILGAKITKYYDTSGFENFEPMIDYSEEAK